VKRLYGRGEAGHAGRSIRSHRRAADRAREATKTVPFVVEGAKDSASRSASAPRPIRRCRGFCGGDERHPADPCRDRGGPPPLHWRDHPSAAALLALKGRMARAPTICPREEEFELAAAAACDSRLELIAHPDQDHGVIEASCGKGTYVRALAARTSAGSSARSATSRPCAAPRRHLWRGARVSLATLEQLGEGLAGREALAGVLLPVERRSTTPRPRHQRFRRG